ncbi:HutD/Ves family protein [Ancylobacter amanitiformis]|uniref:Environmental stress-induced protein Ves n=1 Tax=Ancylobacter amanitiformis TaxID=217069 RepID=A0ABU0LL14_9HYPH|nr:HutD family protein [Ancylobacter amanitiformis]MDQ0509354.1 environmental stress-induced protein Ves [Ancylobacter amanitiformis]
MQILRAADHRVMPWKNGGGSTTEIAVFPEGAGLDAFLWRISMAGVSEDGPFSLFPAIDRSLAVLAGEGIVLEAEGRAPERVGLASAPARFPGDVRTHASLVGGPILDLNVMTRRGRYAHRLTRHVTAARCGIVPEGEVALLLSRSPGLDVGGQVLGVNDAARLPGAVDVTPQGPSEFFLVELWPETGG